MGTAGQTPAIGLGRTGQAQVAAGAASLPLPPALFIQISGKNRTRRQLPQLLSRAPPVSEGCTQLGAIYMVLVLLW